MLSLLHDIVEHLPGTCNQCKYEGTCNTVLGCSLLKFHVRATRLLKEISELAYDVEHNAFLSNIDSHLKTIPHLRKQL